MPQRQNFGHLPDGEAVTAVMIGTEGLRARVISHGARLQDLRLAGVDHPLVLGSDRLEDYLGPMAYFGATVGRYANRIAGGQFRLGDRHYRLDCNEAGRNCLHGGRYGMALQNWRLIEAKQNSARFALTLPDGHMGFPGQLEAEVCYRVSGHRLDIEMQAECSADCPLSMAHHSYFCLDGENDAGRYRLHLPAEQYLPVDAARIPLPESPAGVAGSRFDFRTPRELGTEGIDHCYCYAPCTDGLRRVAHIRSQTGLTLTLESDAPGLQVYDAGHLPTDGLAGLDGRLYRPRAGLALETQQWPDAPNRPDFPDAVIPAGTPYRSLARYHFSKDQAEPTTCAAPR